MCMWCFISAYNLNLCCLGTTIDTSAITITDAKGECSCKIGIKISSKFATLLNQGVVGTYWLVRHYNYNSRPVYNKPANGDQKELFLYYGEIDNKPRNNGWIVNYEFGMIYNSPAMLFHHTDEDSICPEAQGLHWQTTKLGEIPDIKFTCL